MTSVPELDQNRDMGGLADLAGLEAVSEQLAGPIAVLRAEQARRKAGAVVTRAAWKNLIFTGGAGAGKTRAAKAVASIYAGPAGAGIAVVLVLGQPHGLQAPGERERVAVVAAR